jgi:hypothetical protein
VVRHYSFVFWTIRIAIIASLFISVGCAPTLQDEMRLNQQMFDALGHHEYFRWHAARRGGYAYVPLPANESRPKSRIRGGQISDAQLQKLLAAQAQMNATSQPSILDERPRQDRSRSSYVIEGNMAYPTLPGTSIRDYSEY